MTDDVDPLLPDGDATRTRFAMDYSQELHRQMTRFGLQAPDIDVAFLAFVRVVARFGVFSLGPVTIDVRALDDAVSRGHVAGGSIPDDGGFVRLSEAVMREVRRTDASEPDELHYLLAFMRLREGLPGQVFGELGVAPEQVERWLRDGGRANGDLERLYTPEQAAEYLNVTVHTIRAWIRSGRLKASRLAGQRVLRIRASDLSAVLEPVDPHGEEV